MTLVTFFFVALIFRIAYLTLAEGENLTAKAIDQWTRDVPVTGERGNIFDKNGVLLVDTETLYTVYVRPVSVTDKTYTARVLSSVLGVSYENLYAKINSKVSEVTVAKKVTKQELNALLDSGVDGVYYAQNLNRKYVYGDFMTQILGFCNVDGMGQSGVESYYNDYLKGIDGYVLTETDLVGRELDGNITRYIAGQKGADVYLTLDSAIQNFVESAVNTAFIKNNATSASCIVMNAKTGEIVAMAQRPSFDLNDLPRDDVAKLFGMSKSTLVSNVYEPGSTFKILTAAAGLESGAVTTDYHLFCPGYRIVDGQRIKCWRTIGHGSETFAEGVQNSCNCLFMDVAMRVGTERFYDSLSLFGVTEKTGVDMSGEGSGLTIGKDLVKTVDLARMGFGQAIAVTPIELLTACASVVNGGKLMTPYILDSVVMNGKTIVKNYPIQKRTTISEKTSAVMREILESVVEVGGGKNAKVSGYRIGGKTGTAQKYKDGQIARGMYVSTFIGFAPADDPEYIMLFIVDEPKAGAYYGSVVAAPYAGQIFKNIFSYRGWAPAAFEEKPTFVMPDLTNLSVTKSVGILAEKNMYYEIDGDWDQNVVIKSQYPEKGSIVSEDNVVLLCL